MTLGSIDIIIRRHAVGPHWLRFLAELFTPHIPVNPPWTVCYA